MPVTANRSEVVVARPLQTRGRAIPYFVSNVILGTVVWAGRGEAPRWAVIPLACLTIMSLRHFLMGTLLLSKMTITREHLVIWHWPVRHELVWAEVVSLRLVDEGSTPKEKLEATFRDGRTSRLIWLRNWRTRRQEQWPQAILDQVRAHGIVMSDEDRSFLLTGFTSWRGWAQTRLDDPRVLPGWVPAPAPAVSGAGVPAGPAGVVHLFGAAQEWYLTVVYFGGGTVIAGLGITTALFAPAAPSTEMWVLGSAIAAAGLASVWTGLRGTPVFGRMRIDDNGLTVAHWPTTYAFPWEQVETLKLVHDGMFDKMSLQAVFRDGSQSGKLWLMRWRTRKAQNWPALIVAQVAVHGIRMSDEDRTRLLTSFTSTGGHNSYFQV